MIHDGIFGKTYDFDDRDFDAVEDYRSGNQFLNFDNPKLYDALSFLVDYHNLSEEDLKKSRLCIEDGFVTILNDDGNYTTDF